MIYSNLLFQAIGVNRMECQIQQNLTVLEIYEIISMKVVVEKCSNVGDLGNSDKK